MLDWILDLIYLKKVTGVVSRPIMIPICLKMLVAFKDFFFFLNNLLGETACILVVLLCEIITVS